MNATKSQSRWIFTDGEVDAFFCSCTPDRSLFTPVKKHLLSCPHCRTQYLVSRRPGEVPRIFDTKSLQRHI